MQSSSNLSLPALQGDFANMQGDASLLIADEPLIAMAYDEFSRG
jgi:hypothetical protein